MDKNTYSGKWEKAVVERNKKYAEKKTYQKWTKPGNFWYRTNYQGSTIELRWFGRNKTKHAYRINDGDWRYFFGRYNLRTAKIATLNRVFNIINQSTKPLTKHHET